jgi:hypothetical protein
VHEVDPKPVDLSAVVPEPIELRLLPAPVEFGPAREQRAQVLDVGPVLPARAGDVIRPARPCDALAQIGEDFLIDGDGERLDLDSASVRLKRIGAPGWKQRAASRPAGRTFLKGLELEPQ